MARGVQSAGATHKIINNSRREKEHFIHLRAGPLLLAGDPRDVWPALEALEVRLRAGARLERSPNPRKNLVFSASGQYGDMPPGYSIGTNGGGASGRELG